MSLYNFQKEEFEIRRSPTSPGRTATPRGSGRAGVALLHERIRDSTLDSEYGL
jgi:hypothetical protein